MAELAGLSPQRAQIILGLRRVRRDRHAVLAGRAEEVDEQSPLGNHAAAEPRHLVAADRDPRRSIRREALGAGLVGSGVAGADLAEKVWHVREGGMSVALAAADPASAGHSTEAHPS